MTNGGYKILDFNGEEIIRGMEDTQLTTDAISAIKKAESSGKPILITNLKFVQINSSTTSSITEISIPVFFNVCKTEGGYVFTLPNGITGTITEENSITVS